MKFEFIKTDTEQAKDWQNINLAAEGSTFLTSLKWIEFQKTLGKEVETYLIYFGKHAVGNLYIEISRRKIAKYAYCPYGPVIDFYKLRTVWANLDSTKIISTLSADLRTFAVDYCKINKLNLFKIEPPIFDENSDCIKKAGWIKSLSVGQAKDTWVADLPLVKDEKDAEAQILKMQSKATRYEIKKGKKNKIQVIKASSLQHMEDFNSLMRQTKTRQNFENFADSYYIKQWEMLGSSTNQKNPNLCQIWIAYHNQKPVSCALMNYYKDTVFYSHGASASDKELSRLASPYYLHFKIMVDASLANYKHYNFWGIVPKGIPHPWRGLSDFKMKFAGRQISYLGPFEVYANPFRYGLNRVFDYFAFKSIRF